MKIKFSWPLGIILAIALFIIYISSFVYKAMVSPEYDHHLITEDYYQKELKYQSEIDKQKRALNLKQDVVISKKDEGLLITFPKEFDSKKITGIVKLMRLSDEKADIIMPIITQNHQLLIKNEKLIRGTYDLIIDWEVSGETYMYKNKISY